MADKPTAMKDDAIGNPTTWYDGTTFTWVNGRRLASATNIDEGLTATYTYDSDGLRLTKTINGVEHKYLWQGSKLVSEYYDGKELEFFYDESGSPYAFSYKASSTTTPVTYYYLTNLQSDIVGILDSSGTSVATYTYNAWGKLLSSSGDLADVNPLRYRGYYYDAELEMYYLKSRYYDPEICRFINADSYHSTGQGIIGSNMFAYCLNNPVILIDTQGTKSILKMIRSAATQLLDLWLNGDGEDQSFGEDSIVTKRIRASKTMQSKIDAAIADCWSGGANEVKNRPITFSSDEPDLWLGIRNANYDLSITTEYRTVSVFGLFKITLHRSVVKVRVYDTYDFNKGDETGDGLGSFLNNAGYLAQEYNLGTKYNWEATYVYTSKWDW